MTDLRTAAELALDALEEAANVLSWEGFPKAAARLRTALAQGEQEPWATRETFHRELEHMRKSMEIKTVRMRCEGYDIALPIVGIRHGHVLVGQVTVPPSELTQQTVNTVKIPTSTEEAVAMQRVSYAYLKQHAPEVLAQSEQEPVAIHQWRKRGQFNPWHDSEKEEAYSRLDDHYEGRTLYTAPPQREWQRLTDDEVWTLWESHIEQPFPEWFVDFKRAYAVVEQALKEKNT